MNNSVISIEGARIGWKNFSGEAGIYNAKGARTFNIFFTEEEGLFYKEQGWNVKFRQPRNEEDPPYGTLEVSVLFGKYPPKIVLISEKGKSILTEDTVGLLDQSRLSNVDLLVTPYNWEMNGRRGVKAYLKTMYATLLEEDAFAYKYAEVEEVF